MNTAIERPDALWLVKNIHGFPCTDCHKVHEFFTSRCRPIRFRSPHEWSIMERKVAEDAQSRADFDLTAVPLGEPIRITPREAVGLAEVALRGGMSVEASFILIELMRPDNSPERIRYLQHLLKEGHRGN